MRRLVFKPRITSHIRDRILASFPSIALPYMQEKPFKFSYVLYWMQGTVHRSAYIKNNTMPNIGMCHAIECVLAPTTDISPLNCSLVPQAVGSLDNILRNERDNERDSLSSDLVGFLLGFDPVSYFIYL